MKALEHEMRAAYMGSTAQPPPSFSVGRIEFDCPRRHRPQHAHVTETSKITFSRSTSTGSYFSDAFLDLGAIVNEGTQWAADEVVARLKGVV